jgi:hypothetical protein
MRSLIFAAALLSAAPAFATEWVYCGDAKDEASIGRITLTAGDAEWASSDVYGPGKPVAVAQTYIGGSQMVVDLTDEESLEIIAELRVYLAEEGEDFVQGGILRVPGHGAWVVSCEGP